MSDGAPRVLVIDDEVAICELLQRVLRSAYEVTVEASADEAIALLRQRQDYDVVICDLQVPPLTGVDVFESACQSGPDLARRFLFMTGGVQDPRLEAFLASWPYPVLYKPFTPMEVHLALAMIMGAVDP